MRISQMVRSLGDVRLSHSLAVVRESATGRIIDAASKIMQHGIVAILPALLVPENQIWICKYLLTHRGRIFQFRSLSENFGRDA